MDILIAEDNAGLSVLLKDALARAGYTVRTVENGESALRAALKEPPRLVVLDIMMPGMDGLTVCKAIKTAYQDSSVRVIMLSSKRYGNAAREAKRCGADIFLPKPVDLGAFIGEVRRLMDGDPETAGTVRAWGIAAADCFSLDIGSRRIILDAGDGLKRLAEAPRPVNSEVRIFLSNYLPETTSGLGALGRAFDSSFKVDLHLPPDPSGDRRARLLAELKKSGAPRWAGDVVFLSERSIELWPGMRVSSLHTMHPELSLAFRFEFEKRAVVYCPANELGLARGDFDDFGAKLEAFAKCAALLIHDSRCPDGEEGDRRGRGNSSPREAFRLAEAAGVERLALLPGGAVRPPGTYENSVEALRAEAAKKNLGLEVRLCTPGEIFKI